MSVLNKIKQHVFGKRATEVFAFGGYANTREIQATARVLNNKKITETKGDSPFRSLLNSIKRFASSEQSNVEVKATWNGNEQNLLSDKEGYIYLNSSHHYTPRSAQVNFIPLTYQIKRSDEVICTTESKVLIPSPEMEYGVISDIDDTILFTGVASFAKWRLIVNSLFKSSFKRRAFESSAEFYTQLHHGKIKKGQNPIFYLSNSPWNLFDYIHSFLSENQFPAGALLMRDMGLEHRGKKSLEKKNKFLKAKHIFEFYPDKNFILIGDAGEIDVDIYLAITKLFPDRVLAIYIRSVNNRSRVDRVKEVIDNSHSNVKIFAHSKEAQSHAFEKGYI